MPQPFSLPTPASLILGSNNMPRQKRQHLKRRPDGFFVCRYKDQYFYSRNEDDCLAQREEYKRLEKQGILMQYNVREYAEKWVARANPDISPSTMTGLKIHLKKLYSVVGELFLNEVKTSHIKEVYSNCYKGMSNSYIKAGKQLFCALFDAALDDGIIQSNPARSRTAKPHRGTTGTHRAITDQEREWIETLCTDHRAYPAIITMLYAGIRPQEAKALTIEKAYDGESLHITETAHRKGNNQYEISKKMKTEKSRRVVPAFPPVQNALNNRKGLLITTAKGKQITATTWRNAMLSYKHCMETAINGISRRWYGRTREHKAILNNGGKLPPYVEFSVVPYDLRHSFCTWGRDHGVELHTMIEWMGHTDAKMIIKIYDEVKDNRSKTEAEKLLKSAFRGENGGEDENKKPVTLDK